MARRRIAELHPGKADPPADQPAREAVRDDGGGFGEIVIGIIEGREIEDHPCLVVHVGLLPRLLLQVELGPAGEQPVEGAATVQRGPQIGAAVHHGMAHHREGAHLQGLRPEALQLVVKFLPHLLGEPGELLGRHPGERDLQQTRRDGRPFEERRDVHAVPLGSAQRGPHVVDGDRACGRAVGWRWVDLGRCPSDRRSYGTQRSMAVSAAVMTARCAAGLPSDRDQKLLFRRFPRGVLG